MRRNAPGAFRPGGRPGGDRVARRLDRVRAKLSSAPSDRGQRRGLREVGAANRTRVDDYAEAIGEGTAALMRVYTGHCVSAEHAVGVALDDLVELVRKRPLPVLHHLGAVPMDLGEFGLADVPVVSQSIKAGADLVLFSGAKLVGGPQCGIILGRWALVERIGRHPVARRWRWGS